MATTYTTPDHAHGFEPVRGTDCLDAVLVVLDQFRAAVPTKNPVHVHLTWKAEGSRRGETFTWRGGPEFTPAWGNVW